MPTFFCAIALFSLLLKLPGVPALLGLGTCPSCSTITPYIPMLAASYFAFLLTGTLCFRSFPTKVWRIGGLVWATGLAISLTYLSTQVCWVCLVAHSCHIAIWIVWRPKEQQEEMLGMKLALSFTSSLAIMALFSTLNFTFSIYGLPLKNPVGTLVQKGSPVKPFALDAIASNDLANYQGVIFHFVSQGCSYCKEQIPTLDRIAHEHIDAGYRFINVTQGLSQDLIKLGSHLEWVEDTTLLSLFGVQGFPTLVMVDNSGIVVETISGLSPNLETQLLAQLKKH